MPIFVVHEHKAKRAGLHYDLRLEVNGVLKSWAIRKSIPLESGVKRLAIEQENHELEYAEFEGIIEEGYGAGEVKIWDKGKYEPIEIKENRYVVIFNGKRIKGRYVLIKTSRGWLLFKTKG
jgi:DNA ligase D-like protein (predicted 3'-phosphoesterase)